MKTSRECSRCPNFFPESEQRALAISTDIILEISRLASNAPYGTQLDAPLDYENYICVARTLDADQIFWRNLLPKAPVKGVALVLETRLGAISCGMATNFSQVVAWHRSADAARLTQQYADKQKLKNIRIVVAQDFSEIELAVVPLDAVVIFGPSRDLTRQWGADIESLLARTLDQVKDALSDTAIVVIGENNRWAYRAEAQEHRGSARRTGLALPPLRRQMQKRFPHSAVYVCGFPLTSSHTPLPDFLKHDLPLNGLVISKDRVAVMKDALLNLPKMRLFWPAFFMVSSKKKHRSLSEELLCQQQVTSKLGWKPTDRVLVKRIVAGNLGTSIVIGGPANRHTADVVLRMPSRSASIQRCHINASALLRLNHSPLSGLVPRLVCQGNYQGREYTIETRCMGYEINYGTRDLDVMLGRACATVGEFNLQTTEFTPLDAMHLDTLVAPYFADIRAFSSPEIQVRLDKLAETLRRAMLGKIVGLGFAHGDFKASNMLFDRSGTLTAVIDWDGFSENGFQIFDYLTLLVYKIANERRTGLTEAYLEDILPWTLRANDATLVDSAISRLMVNRESFLLVRIVFWFALLADRADPVDKCHAEWHRRFVLPVLPKLERILYDSQIAK